MSRLIVIGGKLQGLEALYLANKAGIETLLFDKNPKAIASKMCDIFICTDILLKPENLISQLKENDIILPALENQEVLEELNRLSIECSFILAFDLNAYNITNSKRLSDKLFRECNMPVPEYYPNCNSPYIGKPSSESGSIGVTFLKDNKDVESFLSGIKNKREWVIQEFLDGPSYSIEIIGKPGNYRTYQVTEIHMDSIYDCRMVTAPCDIGEEEIKLIENMAINLAEKIKLNGIMDLEVIYNKGVMKILEIDARIPSQTPTVVFHSTGMNMIEEIMDIYLYGDFKSKKKNCSNYASFEHYLIENGEVTCQGEHVMGESEPLKLARNQYGADELITDEEPGKNTWHGTFINWSKNSKDLDLKRNNLLNKLKLGAKNE